MDRKHRLAAIMFSDITGYSRIMSESETQALNLLEENLKIHRSFVQEYDGEILKEIGDGILSLFHSSSDAVNCAIQIQDMCKKIPSLKIRIGIHISEVFMKNNDVFGDGVNIASRIEAEGIPGKIYISERVREDIQNKNDVKTLFVGIKKFKNINNPIRIYSVSKRMEFESHIEDDFKNSEVSRENSIAVLPFVNMSSDPEQDYFCDGIAEELINGLTKIRNLNVVARTSSFAFKQNYTDIRTIGEKLNVGLLVEGSIRKAGDRIRITVQLINVEDGFHLWSERYDRMIEDIFSIQDEITMSIVDRLKSTLELKVRKSDYVRSEDVKAYDQYLRGRFLMSKFLPDGLYSAIEHYNKAIEKDPDFSLAYAGLAEAYTILSSGFDILPAKEAMPKAREAATKALDLNPTLPEAYVSLALVAMFHDWNPKLTKEYFNKALELNPNSSLANQWIEFYWSFMVGDFNQSMRVLQKAEEMDPLNILIKIRIGYVYMYQRNFEKAIEFFQRLYKNKTNMPFLNMSLMDSFGQNKQYAEALAHGKQMWLSGARAVANTGVLGFYYALTDQKEKAIELLNNLIDRSIKGYVSSFWIATVYYGLSELDKAFEWYDKACKERDGNLLYITTPPQFDNLRLDDRYPELIKKMGLNKLSHYRFGDIIQW